MAGNVGSSSSPVRSRTSCADAPSSAHAASVRRSCHTIAGWTGRPESRSQTTNVSVWFAMPSAATSPGPAAAAASASAITRSADAAIASGSCSTRPAAGNDEATATEAAPHSRSSSSRTTQRVLEVP